VTLGNTINYDGLETDPEGFYGSNGTVTGSWVWMHESQHTYQAQQLGPLYLLSNGFGLLTDVIGGAEPPGWLDLH